MNTAHLIYTVALLDKVLGKHPGYEYAFACLEREIGTYGIELLEEARDHLDNETRARTK